MSDMSAGSIPAQAPRTAHESTPVAWVAAVLTVLAYGMFVLLIVLNVSNVISDASALFGTLIAIFGVTHVLACLVAWVGSYGKSREIEHGLLRLPHSWMGKLSLALGALFAPAVAMFTGNTLDAIFTALRLPHAGLYFALGGAGLWVLAVSAVGGFLFALIALIRKDRAFSLGLPMMAGGTVILFVLGELLIGHA